MVHCLLHAEIQPTGGQHQVSDTYQKSHTTAFETLCRIDSCKGHPPLRDNVSFFRQQNSRSNYPNFSKHNDNLYRPVQCPMQNEDAHPSDRDSFPPLFEVFELRVHK